jgi:aminomethyltransferase
MTPGLGEAGRHSPLDAAHRGLGAKLVPFGGWEMPLAYPQGTIVEHLACRSGAVAFDVSHLGTIRVEGPGALGRLQATLTNDLTKIGPGRAQYTHLLDENDGSVADDIIVWWVSEERFDVMPNASNTSRVVDAVGGEDVTAERAVIAIQGPTARARLEPVSLEAAGVARFAVRGFEWRGATCVAAGTGYTGEDGVELLLAPEDAPMLWDELVRRGATPAGLAARDTLRLEACFHLYGNDLSTERGPIEAGLGWCCKEDTHFIGAEAVRAVRERDPTHPAEKLVAFVIDGPGIARQHNPVKGGGEVTSGTLSPCLGVGIGLAYVPAERSAVGTRLEIDVRGKIRPAVVKEKPLYRKVP